MSSAAHRENMSVGGDQSREQVFIPVARQKALTRGVLQGVCVMVLVMGAYPIYSGLSFQSSVVRPRIVDISIAVVASPILFAALYFFLRAARWLLLWGWPGTIGVYADRNALTLAIGSFGTWRFDAGRIEAKYPYELSNPQGGLSLPADGGVSDDDDGSFESYLPEEQQRATLLPRLSHPESPEPIGMTILRYVAASESEVASILRPVVRAWRSEDD